MTSIREAAISIEIKKHAYRQTQDGIVISFVMHPNDVSPALAIAPLGTRYMAALVELNDDETPKGQDCDKTTRKTSLAQQAGIRCGEPAFLKFLTEEFVESDEVAEAPQNDFDAAALIRIITDVESRADFDKDPAAGQRWRELEGRYRAWLRV